MIYVAPQSLVFDAHRSLYMFKYKVCEPRDQKLKIKYESEESVRYLWNI